MNIKTKKRIAKEILLFFSALLIILLLFVCLSMWNGYYKNHPIEKKIMVTSDTTIVKFHSLLIEDYYDLPKIETFKKDMLDEKKRTALYNNLKKETKYKDDLPELKIFKEMLFPETEEIIQIENQKVISDRDFKDNVALFSILTFLFFYPVRFIVLLLIWAAKTVKQPEIEQPNKELKQKNDG